MDTGMDKGIETGPGVLSKSFKISRRESLCGTQNCSVSHGEAA
jgi:hypothetical protein